MQHSRRPRRMPHLSILVFIASVFLSTTFCVNGAFAADKVGARSNSSVQFKVLYSFTGGSDGCCIYGGLGRDRHSGDLYGVAYSGYDLTGDGDLFKLTRTQRGYSFHVLEYFSSAKGRECSTTPVVDASGNIFGVCFGGGSGDKGTLWEYSHKGKFKVLHSFDGPGDGMSLQDSVALDGSGHIYGTAYTWGPGGSGTFWKYSLRSGSFTLLHSFADGDDGALLPAGPKIDQETGMIWGTTEFGPNCYYCGQGTVWDYDPSSGTFTTVLTFDSTNILAPQSRVEVGEKGNVFGTAFGSDGGYGNCGLVYGLQKENSYTPSIAYEFTGSDGDGCDAFGRVRFNEQGHLLGTTYDGGEFGDGTIYELEHKNGGWQETILHSFDGSDGVRPQSGLITDHKDNWFGTTSLGGKNKWGTVFEISGVR